jgi:hypothetical protein
MTFSCGYFTQREEKIRIIWKISEIKLGTVSRRTSTERKKTKRKKNIKCPKWKFFRICLKESFHREKKD